MNKFVVNLNTNLESIKKVQDDLEYWSARELMPLLGYSKWQTFSDVLKKATAACVSSGQNIKDHFTGAGKMVSLGSNAEREVDDFLLTRYACYLVAQNGDPRKQEIAYAQTYFAVQTRKQEINEQLSYEDKRLKSRRKLKQTEEKIEQTVYERGIKLPVEFATFKDKHIRALYGGIGIKELKKKRNISEKRALADFDTDVELRAKDFALAMTDHNIKAKDLTGKPILEKEVVENSKATRQVLLKRGIKPEILKPEEDIKQIEKRKAKEKKLQDSKVKLLN
ncbi:MAG: DNA damage-inducible protein D [Ignavibacteriales bacterium]|nr:DNA damage-inducible protein D [Ignavibacteriales bacterium]